MYDHHFGWLVMSQKFGKENQNTLRILEFIKQLPFLFLLCILRDLPSSRRTLGSYAGGGACSLNFICSHVPMEIFLLYKTTEKK